MTDQQLCLKGGHASCVVWIALLSPHEWVSLGTQLSLGITPGKAKQKQEDGLANYRQWLLNKTTGLQNPLRDPWHQRSEPELTTTPYRTGGIETQWRIDVPYNMHIQWALQHLDRQFRHHGQFMFQAFGVLQKRQVAASTCLQVLKKVFCNIKLLSVL